MPLPREEITPPVTKIYFTFFGRAMTSFVVDEFVKEYVGTDVVPKVCRDTQKFAQKFYPEKTIDIWCSPSEDLYKNNVFTKKYHKYFDVVFLNILLQNKHSFSKGGKFLPVRLG